MTYPTLEHVAMQARPYPAHLLEGCETGLCLFAAAFLGHNDAVWFAEAGIKTTCVDIDGERLAEMQALYHDDWEFVVADAFQYADDASHFAYGPWDAVSVDTFTGDAMKKSLGNLWDWCEIANKLVTVTITLDATGDYRTPEGWTSSLFPRSGDVYWLVLTRA